MSQTKTQIVKSSAFGGHLSPIVNGGGGGSSSSSSSTPSHTDDDTLHSLNFNHFNMQHNLHLYPNQNWSNTQPTKNSTQIDSSSSTSSTSSNWSSNHQTEQNSILDEFIKNSSAQSSLNEQRNNDLTDSNWNPFNSLQQTSEQHNSQWSQPQNWQSDGDFADWSAQKKSQQVPPQPQSSSSIKSWAKIVSQQSSPSTNPQTGQLTTNQKNELNQDWDIKVNQTVPWNLDPNNPNQINNNNNNNNNQTVVPSSSTSSAASSSSSTSSISSNEKLINNLIQNQFKQDTGTEIWLGNSQNSKPTLWDQKENVEQQPQQQQQQQQQNWSPNQQAPQWNANQGSWNEGWVDQSLAQQQLMAKIEPTGWDDPDFKQPKKSDDGTNIWGDPEQAKQAKITKWSYYNKQHVPNPATIKPDNDYNNQWKGQQQQQPQQQQLQGSSWNNTPAAPINQSILNDVTNEMKLNNEWNSDLVDTKSWMKESKNEGDWDQGRVDTSNWGINLPSTKNNFDPSIGVVDTSKWTSTSSNGQANPTSQSNPVKPNSQSNTPGLLNMPVTNPTNQDWNSNIFRDDDPRKLNRINSHPSMPQNRLNSSNKMLLNFPPSANPTPNLTQPPPQLGGLNTGSQTPNGLLNGTIQNQLIESFQLAVQANLISPDLLNNKLPPDVLNLLNQLFQTLNLYTASVNRINNLNKRRAQLTAQQYKTELDLLTQESQTYKDNLYMYQKKINAAHLLLKQQQQQQQQFSNNNILPPQTPPGSNLLGNLGQVDVTNNLASAAAAAGVPLSELPILKDNPLQNQSKLIQLIQDQKMGQFNAQKPALNRQTQSNPQNLSKLPLGQSSFFNNTSQVSTPVSGSNQWPNFNSFLPEQPVLDDRITPFIPGKLWTGQGQPSIEDDPNCTPGSFNKPLLTETIDPESILANLTRGNNWSNSIDLLGNQNSLLTGLGGNNRFQNQPQQQQQRNSSWGQNNFNNFNPLGSSLGSSGTIGEQLWGVRSSTSRNGMSGNSPSNNGNRNSANFNPLMTQQQQQQQQQFYRSNSWNVTGQSSQFNGQINGGNNGHYLLIRNVTPQIDQSTLKALCAQHAVGQSPSFRYIPNKQCVIVKYNTKEETNIAHAKLNSISLGNTTINTQLISENDVKSLFFQM